MKKSQNCTQEELTALQDRALELWNEDNGHAMELGSALLAVRAALKWRHGSFKKWWQKHKLSQARVSYCMRLASGKAAAAKERQPTLQQLAARRVKGHLDGFLKLYARPTNSQAQSLDHTEAELQVLFLDIIDAVGELRGWNKADAEDRKRKPSLKNFKAAVANLLDDTFIHETFEDLEYKQPDCMPASQYLESLAAQP